AHTFTTPGAATAAQGVVDAPLYRVQLDVSTSAATLTGATFTTAGSYTGSDISDFKLYFSTDGTLDGGDNLLGTITTSTGAGQSLAFTGLGQIVPIGTRYLFVTSSVSGCASIGATLNIASTPLTAITYTQANKTGTPVAGTSKTIVAGTLANVTGLTASSGAPTVQVSWTNPGCFDQILVVAHTSNITGVPSGTVYSSNLNYGTAPAFTGGGRVVYYGTASPQVITGLTASTNYFFKVFVRKGTAWSSGLQVSATPLNPTFYSVASGVAASGAIWSLTPTGPGVTAASVGGFTVNTSVVVQNGHTVTFSTSNVNLFNLTINSGGIVTAGSTTNIYLNINGSSIINNGILGSIVNDGISFNIEGTTVTWSGAGTNNVSRIRKNATTNATSTLIINSNVNATFAGAAVFNNVDNTNFNVTINILKSLNLTATGGFLGDLAIDGLDGASVGERGGILTVNGTLNMTGRLIATTNNTNATYTPSVVINGGGRIFCKDIDINTTAGTGFPFTIAASGRLSVSGKMRMLGGTLAANNNVIFNSGAVLLHGAGTLDGATACSGTVTGAIQYRRQGTTTVYPSAEYNYWSSPVVNATASIIMGSLSGTNAYTFNPLLATGSTQTGLLPCWTPVTTATTMAQGKGYISTNAGLVTFTGVPYEGTLALPLTGNAFTKFNLVGNPYPSSVSASSIFTTNSGQIVPALHFWDDDNSAGSGFDPADYVVVNTLGASGGNGATWTGQIAAGQSFFVEGATTSNTFTFNNAMRNANAATFFEENSTLKRVWISLTQGAAGTSEAMLAFLPEATNGYDLNYDAARMYVNSDLSLSTVLNNNFYAIQAWPAIDASQLIPLSVNATQPTTHQIQISGIDNIDASVLVFLEDMETGAVHNLREGAYSFEGNAQMSNSNRFRIRFSKPTVFMAEGETCTGFDGKITLESQAGIWNYTLSNAEGQIISNGTSEDVMMFENLDGGDYLYELSRNDYSVSMNIT
ncbi:MAG: beta strand repeat-containing protein, partial [Bacteroidia bacterium]